MRILVTGSRGFVGRNLVVRLGELAGHEVLHFDRGTRASLLPDQVRLADAIVHLAGENRPKEQADFTVGNSELTKVLCAAIKGSGRKIPLIFSSTIQATLANPYGLSKRAAEQAIEQFVDQTGNPTVVYRLPNVFGKWSKPNYNSVVATFCHNMAHDLPIKISDPSNQLRLVYVDDVVSEILCALEQMDDGLRWGQVSPEYSIALGELAGQIEAFKDCRTTLVSERVGTGLVRALYATYISYLPPSKFGYDLPRYGDERGVFVEMLKTTDSGQLSYFTAHPGVTRGGHYHHSKTEKFLVIKGSARFGFRHVVTNEVHEIFVAGDVPQVVESVPGWVHDITNIGSEEMVVMLWANEIFDHDRPDSIKCKV